MTIETGAHTETLIRVRLLFFAVLRDIAGNAESDLILRRGTTAQHVWESLRETYPELAAYPAPPLTAVNMEYVGPQTVLEDGDELAFIPPVSGG